MPIFIGPQSSYQGIHRAPGAHALSGPMFSAPLQNGDAGVSQTIGKMRELIDEALRDPRFISLATSIMRGVPAHDEMAEASAIYNWTLGNIRFTKDPVNKETLFPPLELVKRGAGDCDDFTMLIAALLLAVGINARAITVSVPGEDPSQFSHVYPEAQIDGQWIALDAARPEAMFGAEPPQWVRKRAWSLTDSNFQDLSGTKVYAHPGSTVHVHDSIPRSSLGNYPRFRSLGANRVRTMGDVSPVSQLIATVPQDISAIANAVEGNAYYPYGSFQTAYTPGALVPAGGYSGTVSASGPNIGLLLGMGLAVAILVFGRRY